MLDVDIFRGMTDDALVDALAWHENADGYSRGCDAEERLRADLCKAELRRRLAAKMETKA